MNHIQLDESQKEGDIATIITDSFQYFGKMSIVNFKKRLTKIAIDKRKTK